MDKEKRIDDILKNLIKKGSEISYLKELKQKCIKIISKDQSLADAMNECNKEIIDATEEFLLAKNIYSINYISGISSCLYFPDFNNNGEYIFKIIGGTRKRDKNEKIDESTKFDIASITKLYLLILLFRLEELDIINLNDKINSINPHFPYLEDFTFNDFIRLHGKLRTKGNITQANSREEAYQMLKTIYLVSNSREENTYTDFGSIIISDTLEYVISNKWGRNVGFSEIMYYYLLKPLNLLDTTFNPYSLNLSGNENDYGFVHDPKSRILGGAVGSAGLFTTSGDLASLAKSLFSINYINPRFISRKYLDRIGETTFPYALQCNKGNLGVYVKHPSGLLKTFTPSEFSNGSFSHQGWTGSVVTFDPNNLIHHNILVNAIYESNNPEEIKNDKPIDFNIAFRKYQQQLTASTMLMYILKKYYNKYYNDKEDIKQIKLIK